MKDFPPKWLFYLLFPIWIVIIFFCIVLLFIAEIIFHKDPGADPRDGMHSDEAFLVYERELSMGKE